MLGTNATPQAVADLRSQLGLDKPLLEQFVEYVTGLARLDSAARWQSGPL